MHKDIISFFSGLELVDDFIFLRRGMNIYKSKYSQNKEVIELLFSSDSIFLKDFMFFAGHGVDHLVLSEIFNILATFNTVNLSSVNGDFIKGRGDKDNMNDYYFASKDSLYNHIISTAKSIFLNKEIVKRGDNFINYITLFALMHDLGKIKKLSEKYPILKNIEGEHEVRSSAIAKELFVKLGKEEEYHNFLTLFVDYHGDGKIKRSIKDNMFGDILQTLDSLDREQNHLKQVESKQEQEKVMSNDS